MRRAWVGFGLCVGLAAAVILFPSPDRASNRYGLRFAAGLEQDRPAGPPGRPGIDGPVMQHLDGVPAQIFQTGPAAIVTVDELMRQQAEAEASGPTRRVHESDASEERRGPDGTALSQNAAAAPLSQWPTLIDAASPTTTSLHSVLTSFDGPTFNDSNSYPPDTMGDVGPTQYVAALNGRIRTYNKATGTHDSVLSVTPNVFFATVRNNALTSDPRIRFDRLSNRWVIVYMTVARPNRTLIAVSNDSTITASTSWSLFFMVDTVTGESSQACFGDYPTLGIDANALYIGRNEYCGSVDPPYYASSAFVIPKTALYSGTLTSAGFISLGSGPFTPQGVDNYDLSAPMGFFIGVDQNEWGKLALIQISSAGGPVQAITKTTRAITQGMLTTSFPKPVVALGSTKPLDAFSHRLMNAVARDSQIWTAHAIQVTATGVADTTDPCPECRNGVRWYEVRDVTTTTPVVNQAGTIFDPSTNSPKSYWVPTINVNGAGEVLLAFAAASADSYAGAAFATRSAIDAPGTTTVPTTLVAGAGPYSLPADSGLVYRWGDYSMVSVDPSDDRTFWSIQQYAKPLGGGWATRVARLLDCTYYVSPTSVSVPASGASGALDITVNSGCPWSVGGISPWISLTGSTAGSGNGTVPYSVPANAGLPRSGGIRVAGIDVPFTQAALLIGISAIPNQTTNEDTSLGPLAFTLSGGGAESDLTITASSSNTTLIPNANLALGGAAANRTIAVTPAPNRFGSAAITVTATNGVAAASVTFDVTVNAINDPPAISDTVDQLLGEDGVIGPLAFTVGDVDTAVGSLSISATSSNSTLVPNAAIALGGSGANRTATITPVSNQFGTTTITLTVSDGSATDSDRFTVTVTPVNDAPTISHIVNQDVDEDGAIGPLAFSISDLETSANSLTLTGNSSNPALVPNGAIAFAGRESDRTVRVAPAPNQFGTATISITVSDGTATATDAFSINVRAVNDAPVIDAIPDQSTLEDSSLAGIAVKVSDIETAAGSLSVVATSSNATLLPAAAIVIGGSASNRTLTATPAANQFGTTAITVSAADGAGSTAVSFVLTVQPVNDPPTIGDIPNASALQDAALDPFALSIADLDSAPASISVTGTSSDIALLPPSGIVFGGSGFSRTVTLRPATGRSGTATVTVTVSDGALSSFTAFTLTVNPRVGPPGAPPNFVAVLTGTTLNLSWGVPTTGAPPTEYLLQVAIDAGFAVLVHNESTGSTARTMTIPNVPAGQFFLRVLARNGDGTSPASNVQAIGGPPDPPTDFVATLLGTTLMMTWTAPVTGTSVTDFLVEAALTSSFSPLLYSQGTGSPATSLIIPSVPPGTFHVRLRSRNSGGVSAPSNAQTVTVGCLAAPAAPTALSITKLGSFSARLSWSAPPGGANAATRYVIQAAMTNAFTSLVYNAPLGSATSLETNVPAGTFFVRILAQNGCGVSGPSNVTTLVSP